MMLVDVFERNSKSLSNMSSTQYLYVTITIREELFDYGLMCRRDLKMGTEMMTKWFLLCYHQLRCHSCYRHHCYLRRRSSSRQLGESTLVS